MGAPDGGLGPKTANALRTYQKDKGLPATGRLDTATADALSR
ncbi:peptidoglycan-binding protein [Acidovorax sp. GBBC 3334]|nr:peptidoglycan-binding protein [Acidovorax sp. GBBC 3334]